MKQEQNNKKSAPGLILFGFIMLIAFLSSGAADRDVMVAFLALLIFILPVVLFILIVRAAVKRGKPETHTHDRIDHRSDLQIDSKTGKATRPVIRQHAHSPQEHWKQQLDALLANGTIDKTEYRAMMNRKF